MPFQYFQSNWLKLFSGCKDALQPTRRPLAWYQTTSPKFLNTVCVFLLVRYIETSLFAGQHPPENNNQVKRRKCGKDSKNILCYWDSSHDLWNEDWPNSARGGAADQTKWSSEVIPRSFCARHAVHPLIPAGSKVSEKGQYDLLQIRDQGRGIETIKITSYAYILEVLIAQMASVL